MLVTLAMMEVDYPSLRIVSSPRSWRDCNTVGGELPRGSHPSERRSKRCGGREGRWTPSWRRCPRCERRVTHSAANPRLHYPHRRFWRFRVWGERCITLLRDDLKIPEMSWKYFIYKTYFKCPHLVTILVDWVKSKAPGSGVWRPNPPSRRLE